MKFLAASIGKYQKVFEIGLQNTFVYRWNFLLRSLFGLVPLAGTIFIWQSIFQQRGEDIRGYDYAQMVYYFIVALIVENLVTPTDDEWEIAGQIRDGQINSFLSKPIAYLPYRFALFLSSRLLYSTVTFLPILGVLFYLREYLFLPSDWMVYPLFALSLAMAAMLQFLIAYTMALLAFWILEISTVVFILYSFEYFLSGRLFPLDVMPDSIQAVMKFLPFTYELYFPVAIWMQRVTGPALWEGLLIQAGWVLVFFWLAKTVWRKGIRRYEAVGG